LPDILATDITKLSVFLRPTAFSMANQLAKYAMLGIPEDELFRLCTVNPAKHMGLDAGSLTVGKVADIAVFRKEERAVTFGDRADNTAAIREGKFIYRPMLTIKNGEAVFRDVGM
jgi:predicted amidohydrolase